MVKAEDLLANILADRPVKCENKTIKGDLDLGKLDLLKDEKGRVHIPVSIEITYSDINGVVNFSNAVFEEPVSFNGTKFSGYVDFGGAKFAKEAYFYEAEFGCDAYFKEAVFDDRANFVMAHFGRIADFSEAWFNAEADFVEAKFDDVAGFGFVRFGGDAIFWRARFNGDIAGFGNVQFNGDVVFELAQLGDYAYFIETIFNKQIKLHGAKFNLLYINWNSIKDHLDYDGPAYLALIKNFKIIERFGDADECYYRYRKEGQDQKKLYGGESGWDWSKFSDIASWISCGYGVRPIHTVTCMLCIVVIGWVIFIGISESLFESLYFSVMTFTGGDPDNLTLGRWMRTVAMIEAIFGYLFMALFVVVLGRKFI